MYDDDQVSLCCSVKHSATHPAPPYLVTSGLLLIQGFPDPWPFLTLRLIHWNQSGCQKHADIYLFTELSPSNLTLSSSRGELSLSLFPGPSSTVPGTEEFWKRGKNWHASFLARTRLRWDLPALRSLDVKPGASRMEQLQTCVGRTRHGVRRTREWPPSCPTTAFQILHMLLWVNGQFI